LAPAAAISVWEARQWRAASRYRLLKIASDPSETALEAGLRDHGLRFFAISEGAVAAARRPILLEKVDLSVRPIQCTQRPDAEAAPLREGLLESEVALILSASIKRERTTDQAPTRATRGGARLEDLFFVHIHLKKGPRPLEIDPRRTGFEGTDLASAHMSTREVVRLLAVAAPHDEAFRNIVPALSPAEDLSDDLAAMKKERKGASREPKVVVLDNLAQFREYSAWRGTVERERLKTSTP